jgi:transcriptional regulator with GAF, ATPase, and Fis domain
MRPFPVLIEGESGSGKERVASSLHQLSPRAAKPYLALNCAAISPTLVEPTLFGYAKGAFTGATSARAGYFEEAENGTLFLDEIGELPLELQAKLLRVLENGEYQRVGETQPRFSNARVVAATNRDLRAEIKAGRFRADLYHRLSVFSIAVPPLREMGEDKLTCSTTSATSTPAKPRASRSSSTPRPADVGGLPLPRQRARTAQHRHPPDHQIPRHGSQRPAAGRPNSTPIRPIRRKSRWPTTAGR